MGRAAAVRLFIAFCGRISVPYKRPSFIHPCWYIEYLARHHYSPGAISNHISHLRTYYRLAGLDPAPFHHFRVSLALRAVAMNIRRPQAEKLPVTPKVLRAVLTRIRQGPDHLPLTLGILIMFLGFLRQSSVVPGSVGAFDPSRHLTWADATATPTGLVIKIKWSKTIQKAADQKSILLPQTNDRSLCPVRAFKAYASTIQRPHHDAPLLTFRDGNTLTTRYIARRWSTALKEAGLPVTAYSLHSLRKGGASFAYNDGNAKLNDVMAQGTWRSDAVRSYIRPQDAAPNTVYAALAAL